MEPTTADYLVWKYLSVIINIFTPMLESQKFKYCTREGLESRGLHCLMRFFENILVWMEIFQFLMIASIFFLFQLMLLAPLVPWPYVTRHITVWHSLMSPPHSLLGNLSYLSRRKFTIWIVICCRECPTATIASIWIIRTFSLVIPRSRKWMWVRHRQWKQCFYFRIFIYVFS